jgi:hypothetical protein
MSDTHLQAAHLKVTIRLANGEEVSGRPILYPDAMRLLALRDAYLEGGAFTTSLKPMLNEFHELTGIPASAFYGLTIGEVNDAVAGFFGWRRPTGNGAQFTGTDATTAPSGA